MRGEPRRLLAELYRAAIEAVEGASAVTRALAEERGAYHLVAIGKAAAAMTRGTLAAPTVEIVRGLVVTRHGHGDPGRLGDDRIRLVEADHPVPEQASLAAGAALLDFLASAPNEARFLFLISGGASSLVEVLPEGVTPDDLRHVNERLLAVGLDIAAMNAVRRRLSRIKGGRLCAFLRGRGALALYLSDVPGDDPAVIGSGLLAACGEDPLPGDLPADLAGILARVVAPTIVADCSTVRTRVVATLDDALAAAAESARERGLAVYREPGRLAGHAEEAGYGIARRLIEGVPGVYLWGGEATVSLPLAPGRGGRCQHLALAAAIELDGCGGLALLAAGSDGSDGNTGDAGALIDGGTAARGRLYGLDPRHSLARADSNRFLAAAGDLIHTGPTGTNVADLAIGYRA